MAHPDPVITPDYALYCGDCIDIMKQIKDGAIDLSIYSPPFPAASGGLYTYSSSEEDLSNCYDREEFFEHYTFVIDEITRITRPGRMSAVHCTDVPTGNSGLDALIDLPGALSACTKRGAGILWRGITSGKSRSPSGTAP